MTGSPTENRLVELSTRLADHAARYADCVQALRFPGARMSDEILALHAAYARSRDDLFLFLIATGWTAPDEVTTVLRLDFLSLTAELDLDRGGEDSANQPAGSQGRAVPSRRPSNLG